MREVEKEIFRKWSTQNGSKVDAALLSFPLKRSRGMRKYEAKSLIKGESSRLMGPFQKASSYPLLGEQEEEERLVTVRKECCWSPRRSFFILPFFS